MRPMIAVACLAALVLAVPAGAKTIDEFVAEAERLQAEGDLSQAVALLEEAVVAFPEDATVHAYLGLYRGSQAGQAYQAGNLADAGRFMTEAFELLDKAVALDPDNPRARLYRALMGVNVPPVFGKLNTALDDLKHLVSLSESDPESVPADMVVSAYDLMGRGYAQIDAYQDAIAAYEKVIELSPGSESAKAAEASIAEVAKEAETAQAQTKVEPGEVPALVEKGKVGIASGEFEEAEKLLRAAVEADPDNAEAHKYLAIAMMVPMEGGQLYDERIHEDTDWATNLAFGIMNHLDRAVELAPDDMEARLLNGVMAVNFPFFLGKLDQGIEYLQMVLDSDPPDSARAQAAYWLGAAYQKKGMSHWIEVVNTYPEDEAARMALNAMRPRIAHFDPAAYPRPVVAVDFLIGFRDELPPQTAIWVETPDGEFVRTLYVSGFSGNAKEVQVVLPVWAATSKFVDADAVTGASVDTGEHVYTWDLKDRFGNPVKPGKYVIKVEVHHWPSMKYQAVEGEIDIGEKESQVTVQEGDFIPYLRIHYLP